MDDKQSQLAQLASMIDEAAQHSSALSAIGALRSRNPVRDGAGLIDEEDFHAISRTAVEWAFGYHVNVLQVDGKWRVRIDPFFEGPNGVCSPPRVQNVPDSIVEVWSDLTGFVKSPLGLSRLFHLLFERKIGNVRQNAISAAKNYVAASRCYSSGLDKEGFLNPALRVARAVGAGDVAAEAIQEIVACIRDSISGDDPAPGVALRLLGPTVDDRDSSEDIDELIESVIDANSSPFIQDELIALKIRRCSSADEKVALEGRRVRIWIDAANAESGLVKSGHLKTALQRAQNTGQKALIERAAAALQKMREEDLGLVSFTSSMQIDREKLEGILSPMVKAPSWREALVLFVWAYGPAVGSVERNRDNAEEFARNAVFLSLLNTELLGPDGLPRFSAQNEDDKAEMRLAQQENFALQNSSPLLAMALSKIAEVHGIPSEEDLAEFFSQGALTDEQLAASIARCFIRYWTRDYEGATFTIAPKIETLLRNLVLALDEGVYRLQRQEKPGQFPGMGALLRVLKDKGLDESWYRNILTICANPAGGWNIRNELAHGFVEAASAPAAAVLFQCVLYLCFLGVNESLQPVGQSDQGDEASLGGDEGDEAQGLTDEPDQP
ncbi:MULTISPECIES: DUF4209 domain-containing protein [Streptomyces]|uniref:DUF4209 domain-containing protein n=1 Tax=Streptomyces TaxID=1883 RepID=UPI003683A2B1